MRRYDPPAGLPLGDPVPDAEPVGEITGTVLLPRLARICLNDQTEQLALSGGDVRVDDVHSLDELFVGSVVRSHDVSSIVGKVRVLYSNTCSVVKRFRLQALEKIVEPIHSRLTFRPPLHEVFVAEHEWSRFLGYLLDLHALRAVRE